MIKQRIARLSAKLLRAAVNRIAGDIELAAKLEASFSSASLVNARMPHPQVHRTREAVLRAAVDASTVNGFICELGVYKGNSINCLATHFPDRPVYGFDTFTGLPDAWRPGFPKGTFATDADGIKLKENCVLYRGMFADTLPRFLDDIPAPACLIHVDCDLYSSTMSALTCMRERICTGTVILFDEYFNYPGWQEHEHKALQEFAHDEGLSYDYLAYNSTGQQVAIIVTERTTIRTTSLPTATQSSLT